MLAGSTYVSSRMKKFIISKNVTVAIILFNSSTVVMTFVLNTFLTLTLTVLVEKQIEVACNMYIDS